ncbi:extracellular solute-binding protein [Aeromicrobium sp. CF3.5]|uniref:extracellular solute-binding protein n=1 Tax=Aeromicrobium sp. CF3.5 TaxID=3373078 RepID=UPI003EE7975F
MSVVGRVLARGTSFCLVLGLAACGSTEGSDSSVIDWWVAPDRIDAVGLAVDCQAVSGGPDVRVRELPQDIDDRHTELVRRLSADNGSVDLVSLDTELVPEITRAGFLAPLSTGQQQRWGEDVAPGVLATSMYDGELAAAPWWFDPQLLWFRGVVAERAGLDTEAPITWDALLAGAERLGVTVQIQDDDGTATSAWVTALGADRTAATIIESYRTSGLNPGPADDATDQFATSTGGFLLAPSSALSSPALQLLAPELGYTAYPVSTETESPGSGVSLAVTRDSDAKADAADLISCLTTPAAQRALAVDTGHGVPRLSVYDDETLIDESPTAEVVATALRTVQPVPVVPSWNAVRRALDDTWSPLAGVDAGATPGESQRAVAAATDGELP